MFSIRVTNTLIADADNFGDKISITRFKVGRIPISLLPDLKDKTPDYDFSDHPQLLDTAWVETNFVEDYAGDENQINYTTLDLNGTILTCFLPQNVDFFNYNTVLLYATQDGVEQLFTWHYDRTNNPKFSVQENKHGLKYYFILNLKTTLRDARFDFSNLTRVAPEFDHVFSLFDLEEPSVKEHDQFILWQHEQAHHSGPFTVFNSQEQYFGAPLVQLPMDEERPVMLPLQGQYYPLAEGDPVPSGYTLVVDGAANPILDRWGFQMITPE